VAITCIANMIPVFIVGKPGSSKTLTLQVIQSNLQGERSRNPFWTRFPQVCCSSPSFKRKEKQFHLYYFSIISSRLSFPCIFPLSFVSFSLHQVNTFPYQCSPLSTAHGIQVQYDKACTFQKSQESRMQRDQEVEKEEDNEEEAAAPTQFKSHGHVTILLLDEVGLAEHSPDLPLKVLHRILVERRISVVGLSNWVLDPAKMNRAVLLNRPDPTEEDLRFTGEAISGVTNARQGTEYGVRDQRLLRAFDCEFRLECHRSQQAFAGHSGQSLSLYLQCARRTRFRGHARLL